VGLAKHLNVETIAECEFDCRLGLPVATREGGRLISFVDDAEAIIVDAALK
jgi:hypothetical protein